MPIVRIVVISVAVSLIVAASGAQAGAQVPPHTPGTICFTPKFWCWAQTPGPPGKSCACRTPNGWVPGRLG